MAGQSQSSSRPGAPGPRAFPVLIPQGALAGQPEVPLDRPVTTVGSNENARLHLVSRTVSKGHAIFVNDGPVTYVADLASRTGVLVNAKLVKEAQLKTGDRVQIGKFVFRYRSATLPGTPPAPQPPPAAIIVVGWPAMPVASKVVQIGRRETSDIALTDDAGVSAAHAVIFQMNGNWYARDLGSRTGTIINGKAIHQQVLNFGDRIAIGSSTILFQPGASITEPLAEPLTEPEFQETPAAIPSHLPADLQEDFAGGSIDQNPETDPIPIAEDAIPLEEAPAHHKADWKSAFPVAVPITETEEPSAEPDAESEHELEAQAEAVPLSEETVLAGSELPAGSVDSHLQPAPHAEAIPLAEWTEPVAAAAEMPPPAESVEAHFAAEPEAAAIPLEGSTEPAAAANAPAEPVEPPFDVQPAAEEIPLEELPEPAAAMSGPAEPIAESAPIGLEAKAVEAIPEPVADTAAEPPAVEPPQEAKPEPAITQMAATPTPVEEIAVPAGVEGLEPPRAVAEAPLPAAPAEPLAAEAEPPMPAAGSVEPVATSHAESPPVVDEPVVRVADLPPTMIPAPSVPADLIAEVEDFVFIPGVEAVDPNAIPDVIFWGEDDLDATAGQAVTAPAPPAPARTASEPAPPPEDLPPPPVIEDETPSSGGPPSQAQTPSLSPLDQRPAEPVAAVDETHAESTPPVIAVDSLTSSAIGDEQATITGDLETPPAAGLEESESTIAEITISSFENHAAEPQTDSAAAEAQPEQPIAAPDVVRVEPEPAIVGEISAVEITDEITENPTDQAAPESTAEVVPTITPTSDIPLNVEDAGNSIQTNPVSPEVAEESSLPKAEQAVPPIQPALIEIDRAKDAVASSADDRIEVSPIEPLPGRESAAAPDLVAEGELPLAPQPSPPAAEIESTADPEFLFFGNLDDAEAQQLEAAATEFIHTVAIEPVDQAQAHLEIAAQASEPEAPAFSAGAQVETPPPESAGMGDPSAFVVSAAAVTTAAAVPSVGDLASAMVEAREQLGLPDVHFEPAAHPAGPEAEPGVELVSAPVELTAETGSATHSQEEPSQSGSIQIEPTQNEPIQAEPFQAEPFQAEPIATAQTEAEPIEVALPPPEPGSVETTDESLPSLHSADTEPTDWSAISTVDDLDANRLVTHTEQPIVEQTSDGDYIEPVAADEPEWIEPDAEDSDAKEFEVETPAASEIAAENQIVDAESQISDPVDVEITAEAFTTEPLAAEPLPMESLAEDPLQSQVLFASTPAEVPPVEAIDVEAISSVEIYPGAEDLEFLEPEAEAEPSAATDPEPQSPSVTEWSAVSTIDELPTGADFTRSDSVPALETDDLEFLEFTDGPVEPLPQTAESLAQTQAVESAPVESTPPVEPPPITEAVAEKLPEPVEPAAEKPDVPRKGKLSGPPLFGFDFDGGSFLGGMPLPLNVPLPPVAPQAPAKSVAFDALASPPSGLGSAGAVKPVAPVVEPPAAPRPSPATSRRPAQPPAVKSASPVTPPSLSGMVSNAGAPHGATPFIPPTAPNTKPAGNRLRPAASPKPLAAPLSGTFNLPTKKTRNADVFSQVSEPIGVEVFGGRPGNPDQFVVPDIRKTNGELPAAALAGDDPSSAAAMMPAAPVRKPRRSLLPLLIPLLLGLPALFWYLSFHYVPISSSIVGSLSFTGLDSSKVDARTFQHDQETRLYSDDVRNAALTILQQQNIPPGFVADHELYAQIVDRQFLNWNGSTLEFTYNTSEPDLGRARVEAVLTALKQKDQDLLTNRDRALAEANAAMAAVNNLNAKQERLLKEHIQAAADAEKGPDGDAVYQVKQQLSAQKSKWEQATAVLQASQTALDELKSQDPTKPIEIEKDPQVIELEKQLAAVNDEIRDRRGTGPVTTNSPPGLGTDVSIGATTQPDQADPILALYQKNAADLQKKLDDRRNELSAIQALGTAQRQVNLENAREQLSIKISALTLAEKSAKAEYDATAKIAAANQKMVDAATIATAKKEDLKAQIDETKKEQADSADKAAEKNEALAKCVTVADLGSDPNPKIGAANVTANLRLPVFLMATSISSFILGLLIWGELRRPKFMTGVQRPDAGPLVSRPQRLVPWPQPQQLQGLEPAPVVSDEMLV